MTALPMVVFYILKICLKHSKFDVTMSPPLPRQLSLHDHAVAVIPYRHIRLTGSYKVAISEMMFLT